MEEFPSVLMFSQDCLFDYLAPTEGLIEAIGASAVAQITHKVAEVSGVEPLELPEMLGMMAIDNSQFTQTVFKFAQ